MRQRRTTGSRGRVSRPSVGLLTSVTATEHTRAGRLVSLLTALVTDHLGVYVSPLAPTAYS